MISNFFSWSYCSIVLEPAFCPLMGIWKKRPVTQSNWDFPREVVFPPKTSTVGSGVLGWGGGREEGSYASFIALSEHKESAASRSLSHPGADDSRAIQRRNGSSWNHITAAVSIIIPILISAVWLESELACGKGTGSSLYRSCGNLYEVYTR